MRIKPSKPLVDDPDLKIDVVATTGDDPFPLPCARELKAALSVLRKRKSPRRMGKRPKASSADVRDADIAVSVDGIWSDLTLVARVLRSNARLSRRLRDTLAELFEDRGSLKVVKRPPGRGNWQKKRNGLVTLYLRGRIRAHQKAIKEKHPNLLQKQIDAELMKAFGLSRSTLKEYLKAF